MQPRIQKSQSSRSTNYEEKDVEINTFRRVIHKIHRDDKKIHGEENYIKETMKIMLKMLKMLVFLIMFLVMIFVLLMCILINKW